MWSNKKGSCLTTCIVSLVIIVIVAGALMFFIKNRGNGKSLGTITETTLETTQETVRLEEIMISDNSYLYQNNKMELEQLIEILKNKKDIGIVQIKENNASEKAYRELIKALDDSNVKYVEKVPETSEER